MYMYICMRVLYRGNPTTHVHHPNSDLESVNTTWSFEPGTDSERIIEITANERRNEQKEVRAGHRGSVTRTLTQVQGTLERNTSKLSLALRML